MEFLRSGSSKNQRVIPPLGFFEEPMESLWTLVIGVVVDTCYTCQEESLLTLVILVKSRGITTDDDDSVFNEGGKK